VVRYNVYFLGEKIKWYRRWKGVTVSTLYNAEYEADCKIKDEDKTAFDWCKEGNVKEMTKILEKSKTGANVKDDQVYRYCTF
jgi:hypothetical protein